MCSKKEIAYDNVLHQGRALHYASRDDNNVGGKSGIVRFFAHSHCYLGIHLKLFTMVVNYRCHYTTMLPLLMEAFFS